MRRFQIASLMLCVATGLMAFAGEASAQKSCPDRCVKVCQDRGATGSMMNACITRCTSGCEQTRSENKSKPKKQ
jgi:hypothetical protein